MGRLQCWRSARLRSKPSQATFISMMFYDISFSSSVGALAWGLQSTMLSCDHGLLRCSTSLPALFALILFFVPMWWNTYLLKLYTARFATDDMFFMAYLYAQMLANLAMAVNTVDCANSNNAYCRQVFFASGDDTFHYFALSQCLSQFMAATMFSRGRTIAVASRWSLLYASSSAVSAVAWIVAAALPQGVVRTVVVSFTMVVHVGTEFVARMDLVSFRQKVPAAARADMRKFVIVMMTLVVRGTFSPVDKYTVSMLCAAAGMVLLVVLIKILYFDLDGGDNAAMCGDSREVIWVLANLVLCGSIVVLGACSTVVVAHSTTTTGVAVYRVRWLLCAALAVVLLSTILVKLSLKGAGHLARRWRRAKRLTIRAAFAVAFLFLPLLFDMLAPMPLVWLMCSLLAIQVLVDIYGSTRRQRMRPEESVYDTIIRCCVGSDDSEEGEEGTGADGRGSDGTGGGGNDQIGVAAQPHSEHLPLLAPASTAPSST